MLKQLHEDALEIVRTKGSTWVINPDTGLWYQSHDKVVVAKRIAELQSEIAHYS